MKPCPQCPFSKLNKMKGYLGPHESSDEIVAGIMADQKFPCHMQANNIFKGLEFRLADVPRDKVWLATVAIAPHCAGSLAFMNHQFKRSRDRETSHQQDKVGYNTDVFKTLQEMQKHHDK